MFTSYDKAIVALVMSILSIISLWFGWGSVEGAVEHLPNITETPNLAEVVKPVVEAAGNLLPPTVTSVISILTPFLVWAIPNKR